MGMIYPLFNQVQIIVHRRKIPIVRTMLEMLVFVFLIIMLHIVRMI